MIRLLKLTVLSVISVVLVALLIAVPVLIYFSNNLPDHQELENYQPKTMTRLYSIDGEIIEEYAREKRIFIPITSVPKVVIDAFISAEDKNFYSHHGIDPEGILRAFINNITTNNRLHGGSTITQQVAKNILLSNERTLSRKIKELILAIRIDKSLTKERILEIYLNEIYLGGGSYGIAAAAMHYFNKSVTDLNVQEAALLAALPKAPSNYDPRKDYDAALRRRNLVLQRMNEEGYLNNYLYKQVVDSPIELRDNTITSKKTASSYTEEVRRIISSELGSKAIYEDGLVIHTSLKPKLQDIAKNSLRNGLVEYSMRHGYMGPVTTLPNILNWRDILNKINKPEGAENWKLAVVLNINEIDKIIEIGTDENLLSFINFKNIEWTKKRYNEEYLDEKRPIKDVFNVGDVILVEKSNNDTSPYELRQIPEINGAILAMDPKTGHVLAMVGGFSSENSQFNRATQARRQPGSAFKPFVYLSALESGYSPVNLINDEPIEFDRKTGKLFTGRLSGNGTQDWAAETEEESQIWAPQNHSGDFYGPTTLRTALEKSRNVSTVHLGLALGVEKIVDVTKRFGINSNPPANLSTVLGTAETTLIDLVGAYAAIANGGYKVTPQLIDRIQDRNGRTIFNNDNSSCDGCMVNSIFENTAKTPPKIYTNQSVVSDERSTYQLTSMLQGVIERGTAKKAKSLGIPLAGKTGTTQKSRDAWFIGYTPDLAVGVYAGFDDPASLGRWEEGSTIALPIFIDFIKDAVNKNDTTPFLIPDGIELVRVDSRTGFLPSEQTPQDEIIIEAFKEGKAPKSSKLRTDPLPIINKDMQTIPINELPTRGIY